MTRLKLTSPGVLLILAVVAAGSIFLLDLFCLRPYTESQKWSALREEAVRTEHATEVALQAEQTSLAHVAAVWAHSPQLRAWFASGAEGEPEAVPAPASERTETDAVWLVGADGTLRWARSIGPDDVGGPAEAETGLRTLAECPDAVTSGLVLLTSGPAVFGRHTIGATEERPAGEGSVVLIRRLDADVLDRLSLAAGGKLVVVLDKQRPEGANVATAADQKLWLTAKDRLAVAWPQRDAAGEELGYFLATVSVVHIHRQAVGSRRMVLIILSLSVGLALLVILGSHMLITGPVVRLLGRLQRLEEGDGNARDLARDLHGEPLMLARRLENAFQRLAYISKTDQLTGLANRRHFEEVLDAFYHQARRYNRPMSVMVMDVDYFKAVNDAGGHQAGDEALKRVASAVEDACRRADLAARFGGDEFAVLLPETAADDARAVGERIRQSIAAEKLQAGGVDINLTVSAGIADLNAGEMDGPGAMMGLADRALYAAKQLGRNRIVQAHDLHVAPVDSKDSESRKINVLSKKLAGLDEQFKELFLMAFAEVMAILQQRDLHMADHTRKVRHYAVLIGEEMELPDRVIQRIEVAALMHDLGMVALPDSILLSPGPLTADECKLMRRHPLLSVRIMERMEFLEQEIPAVRYHHERYDGNGYPEGIAGPSIPLTARILAVADAFDAMTSPRVYRDAKSLSEAIGEIARAASSQFDPTVVNAFMQVADRLGQELLHVPGLDGEDDDLFAADRSRGLSASWRTDAPEPVAEVTEDGPAGASRNG